MTEFESQPSPEEVERRELIRIIEQYLPDDSDYLLETHPDNDDLRMAIDASLLAQGLDPDEILMDTGEYTDVRYESENEDEDEDEV